MLCFKLMNGTAGYTIRDATSDDLASISDIYNYYVLNSTATFDLEPEAMSQRQTWFGKHQEDKLPVVVLIDENGQVAGFGSLSYYHSRPAYKITLEPSIYIAKASAKLGLGKKLMIELLAQAHKLGAHSLVGLICSENADSLKLIESFGFSQVGLLKQVGEKFGRRLDVTLVQLIL